MIPLYKNNYVRTSGHGTSFTVEIDPLFSKVDNFYVESCKAAKELYDLKQGKFHILYSGGLDSEHCLSVFLSLGMDVTPVIVKLNSDYNYHDIKYAFDFCKSKNIKPLIIDIDFDKFVESGQIFDICTKMKSSAFGRAPIAYAAGLLDGTVISGDGEPYVKKNEEDNIWYLTEEENDFSIYNYFKLYGIHGTTHYSRFTPEMFAAFMIDPRMVELANNQHVGKLSTYSSRTIIYNRYSNFDLQPRTKYTGFEKIIGHDNFKNHPVLEEIEKFGKSHQGNYKISYQEFMKNFYFP